MGKMSKEYHRKWRAKNYAKTRASEDSYYQRNKDNPEFIRKKRAYAKAWRKKNKEHKAAYAREHALKSKYGMTLEDYDQLLEEQGGGCAVCGATKSLGRDTLNVDHCHTTGKIRGILCSECNMALGLLGDDPERIRKLEEYL